MRNERIGNAWDVEATEVHVTVPNILTESPIIAQDNDSGMRTAEVETEYLHSKFASYPLPDTLKPLKHNFGATI